MKRFLIVACVSSSLLLMACHQKAMTQSNHPLPSVPSVVIDPQADISATGASYNIDSVYVTNDTLAILVTYGGGCKAHSFELISNGMYSKSLPPQVTVCLKHTGNDDHCRMLVMKELKFDISRLRYERNKAVTIKLSNKQINYSAIYTYK